MRTTPATAEPLTPDDPAVLLMSGGTTGTPKGVLGRHGAYVATGLQLVVWTRSALVPGRDVIFLPLPLFHVYAQVGVTALAIEAKKTLMMDRDELLQEANESGIAIEAVF